MSEEIKVVNDTQETVVESQVREDDFELIDLEEEEDEEQEAESEEQEEKEQEDKKDDKNEEEESAEAKQSPEDNAKFAAARRKAEQEAQKSKQELQELLQSFGYETIDDYKRGDKKTVGEATDGAKGVDGFWFGEDGEQKPEEKKSKPIDSNNDRYKKYIEKKIIEEAEAKYNRIKADNEVREFKEKFPHVDVNTLTSNETFMEFADGKLGRQSLSAVYESYSKFISKFDTGAKAVPAKATGGSSAVSNVSLTSAEKKALDDWNAKYPELQMTPEEFKKH